MGDYGISVVIPAYNVEKYIAATIDSVLAQSYKPDEIIVIDDGSKDATGQIVQRYPQVRYIRQDNAGVSVARNTGVEAANFPWIAFLDGDDQWLPDKLAEQIELLKRNPNLVWVAGNYIFNDLRKNKKNLFVPERKATAWVRDKDYIEFFPHYKDFGITSNVILKKDAYIAAGGSRPGLTRGQDVDLWIRVAFRYPNVGYCSSPGIIYNFFRDGSTAMKRESDRQESLQERIDMFRDLFEQAVSFDKVAGMKLIVERSLKGMARRVCRHKDYHLAELILDNCSDMMRAGTRLYLKRHILVGKLKSVVKKSV